MTSSFNVIVYELFNVIHACTLTQPLPSFVPTMQQQETYINVFCGVYYTWNPPDLNFNTKKSTYEVWSLGPLEDYIL